MLFYYCFPILFILWPIKSLVLKVKSWYEKGMAKKVNNEICTDYVLRWALRGACEIIFYFLAIPMLSGFHSPFYN